MIKPKSNFVKKKIKQNKDKEYIRDLLAIEKVMLGFNPRLNFKGRILRQEYKKEWEAICKELNPEEYKRMIKWDKMVKEGKIQDMLWHHGTCSSCKKRQVLICHFGYKNQFEPPYYQACEECLKKKAGLVYTNQK